MVINSILTIQLENIHVSIPSNHIRTQSAPPKPTKRSPHRSRKERKRPVHHQIFIPDKPPFINYASAYINPYRYLTPVIINRDHHRPFKRTKRTKRKKEPIENVINKEQNKIEENLFPTQIIQNTDPIDLWPSDPNSFDMDFIRKRQIAIDNTFYRETIDEWKPSSLNHLSILIKELTIEKNLIDRVWIIYYWISQNILYDIDANKQESDDIFHSRKATCEGYATIFQTLCDKNGIKCVKISGFVKESHFHINQTTFSHPNHTWNSVQLDDHHWYLIDSAWGSGYINNKHEYKQNLQTYYFLTRPEYIIYNHLPKESQWQLLAKPISIFDYFRLPFLHSYYFIYDLTIVSPRFSSIIIFDAIESLAEVLIQAPNDIQLTCSSKDENRSTSLTQYDANRQIWQCLFAPYKSGFYTLVIFANRLSISNSLINVIELGVEVSSKNFSKRKILPITFGKFIEYKCQIISPLNGILKRGTTVMIHCRIPNASYGRISIDGIWLEEIIIKDKVFKQEIIVPEREIIVYAQFINKKLSNIYHGLIRYLVEK
jgi:hypothetical protein